MPENPVVVFAAAAYHGARATGRVRTAFIGRCMEWNSDGDQEVCAGSHLVVDPAAWRRQRLTYFGISTVSITLITPFDCITS
jgi:hypothetical protein